MQLDDTITITAPADMADELRLIEAIAALVDDLDMEHRDSEPRR
jgi:hypothetical protein